MSLFKQILIQVFILSVLVSCGSNMSSNFASPLMDSSVPVSSGRLLIKLAELEIEVEDPELTTNEIEMVVSRYAGYVDNVYVRDQKRISMTVKVPEKKLELFTQEISSVGQLISKSFSSRDVTKEAVDLKASLENLKVLRKRFRKLLDKALNVSDVLKIESELSRVQTEIDSIEVRRNSLKNQVILSKVNISITQKTVYGSLGYLGKGLYWLVK